MSEDKDLDTDMDAARLVHTTERAQDAKCPTCGQRIKTYRRHLNAGMAASLIWIVTEYERNGQKWVDVPRRAPRHVLANRELGRLVHWGLLETKPVDPDKPRISRNSGRWRPTKAGIMFVFEKSFVPKWVELRANEPQRWCPDSFGVRDALRTKFNYDELIKASR